MSGPRGAEFGGSGALGEPTWEQLEDGRPPMPEQEIGDMTTLGLANALRAVLRRLEGVTGEQVAEARALAELELEDWGREQSKRQEAVTEAALAVMVGSVDSGAHGSVQAELRRIQVAVRGQMDGIRPIEAVVLTYRWTKASGGWVFEELQSLVQGMDGALKPGTVMDSATWHMLGPSLGWAWDIVHAHWPRG